MTLSGEQNVTSNIYLHNISVLDTLATTNLLYKNNVTINPVELSAKEAVVLKGRIQAQEERILRLQQKLSEAIRINEDMVMTGKKVE